MFNSKFKIHQAKIPLLFVRLKKSPPTHVYNAQPPKVPKLNKIKKVNKKNLETEKITIVIIITKKRNLPHCLHLSLSDSLQLDPKNYSFIYWFFICV